MTSATDNFRVFRVRMKCSAGDLTKDAWNMQQVGIWYGAWSPQQLEETIKIDKEKGRKVALKYLAAREKENGCRWTSKTGSYKNSYFNTCKYFRAIKAHKDWVTVSFDQKLCLGQLASDIQTNDQHELNIKDETFHSRRVINQKCFPLAELPDVYKFIPQSCQRTVYKYRVFNRQLKLLVNCKNSDEVNQYLQKLSADKWLDFLSPTEWESFCLGYLIIEHDYRPTGLLTGGTMKTYDVVGKTRGGAPILAQCKKIPRAHGISNGFKRACSQFDKNLKAFWFAYGGANADPNHPNIQVIDKTHMKEWLETKQGKDYLNVFRGQKT